MPSWLNFDQISEWVSGAWWSYFVIFGVAAVDAFFPLVPSETVVIIGGNLSASGALTCRWSSSPHRPARSWATTCDSKPASR